MSKHTPGPWRIVEREVLEDGSVYPRHIVGGDRDLQIVLLEGMAVAEFAHANPSSIWDVTGIAQANARLIAAAPDLLTLVRRYASECGQCAGIGIENVKWFSTGIECDGERPCEECADIRAAIAKATGEA